MDDRALHDEEAWLKQERRRSLLPRVRKFQSAFVKYFPQLDDIENAGNEWSWLHSHWLLNQIDTMRRSQALEELETVIRALRLLAKGSHWSWWGALYDAQKASEADDAD